jgi:hypothetical protein
MPALARPRAGWMRAAGAVTAAGLIALGAILALRSSDRSSTAAQRAEATTYPADYAVVYRDRVNDVPHWEVLEVHRPFAASDLTYVGTQAPGRTAPASGGWISTATALYQLDLSGRRPARRAPAHARGDGRPRR